MFQLFCFGAHIHHRALQARLCRKRVRPAEHPEVCAVACPARGAREEGEPRGEDARLLAKKKKHCLRQYVYFFSTSKASNFVPVKQAAPSLNGLLRFAATNAGDAGRPSRRLHCVSR